MKSAKFSKVIIIQSLSDVFTGNRLQDDLSILTVFTQGIVTSELINVNSKEQFIKLLHRIKQDVQNDEYLPIIHIEAHGNEDNTGLILANNDDVSWIEMKRPLSEINIATRLNLLLCISACYGGSFASALNIEDRAPCWAMIGPKDEMYPDDLLRDYTRFYEEILKTGSGGSGLKQLNDSFTGNDAKYFFMTAEQFFEIVWTGYLRKQCSNDELNKRANAIVRELRRKKPVGVSIIPSRNEMKNDLIRRNPEYFDIKKKHFFMMDLFGENENRFTVSYDTVHEKSMEAQP
jgi:hypothetical protein